MTRPAWFILALTSQLAVACTSTEPKPEPAAAPSASRQDPSEIPEGWRLTSYGKESNCNLPDEPPPNAAITGDFDGDGETDYAKILRSESEKREVLMVWLSSEGFHRPQTLAQIDREHFNRMTISLAKRGQPKLAHLATDGIWYTLCESTSTLFTWDRSSGKFVQQQAD